MIEPGLSNNGSLHLVKSQEPCSCAVLKCLRCQSNAEDLEDSSKVAHLQRMLEGRRIWSLTSVKDESCCSSYRVGAFIIKKAGRQATLLSPPMSSYLGYFSEGASHSGRTSCSQSFLEMSSWDCLDMSLLVGCKSIKLMVRWSAGSSVISVMNLILTYAESPAFCRSQRLGRRCRVNEKNTQPSFLRDKSFIFSIFQSSFYIPYAKFIVKRRISPITKSYTVTT